MSQRDRHQQPRRLENWWLALVCAGVLGAVLAVWASAAAGAALAGTPAVTGNPFGYVFALALGQRSWPGTAATLVLAGIGLALAAAAVTVFARRRRRARQPTAYRVDRAAELMARPSELHLLSPAGVADSAQRLRPASTIDRADPTQHGRQLGVTVLGDIPVRSSWEDMGVHLWGPRRGKTTAETIPNVVEAPGPALATTNKRDLPDATRGPRAARGTVYIFDPQQVATEPPRFWYNPLSRIADIRDAQIVAGHFAAGARGPDAKVDAYFDNAAENLLAAYLLAAARDGRTLVQVYEWLSNRRRKDGENALTQHGDTLVAADVRSIQEAPDKQQAGVFDTAKNLLGCLRDPAVLEWVTPPADHRPEFRPQEFVTSTDTLYSLSMEGAGSAAPLVAALTEHVCHAADLASRNQPLGRLDPPLYCALDEAANVVRWRDLPNLYSHMGSRGIVIDTILQSWAQGVEVWGEKGMGKLWSAANVRTYGGGISDSEWLRQLSDLIGDHDREQFSTTLDGGRRTYSHSAQQDRVLTVDLLASLPPGRAIVLASGAPAFLIRTVPWWHGDWAPAIRDSLTHHDPGTSAA